MKEFTDKLRNLMSLHNGLQVRTGVNGVRGDSQATPLLPRVRSVPVFELIPSLLGWWKETCQLLGGLVRGKTLITVSLLLILVISGVSAIYSVHLNRQLFIELQALQAEQDQAQRRWTQLLLEEGAWSSPNRVEHIASTQLGMVIPATGQMEMVK